MNNYAESIIQIVEDQSSTNSLIYHSMSKSQRMKAIYHEMKEIILHDPVFRTWLVGDEHSRNWLLERVMKCYFIDGVCWFDESIHRGDFSKTYKWPVLNYITQRRTAERRKRRV